MSDLPLVSIITPSYNQGRFIEETILSIRDQVYQNIEHIIVDGGSTDNTLEVLQRYDGTYNMCWISEPDGGMYEAINKGLRRASGDILAYLNSDDRYFPWTVFVAEQTLAQHPEVGFVFGDMLNVNEGTDSVRLLFYPPFRSGYIRRLGFLGQPTVFWRRFVLDKLGGFDESLKFVADCDYWMRIGGCYSAYKVNEVLAIERDHPEAKRLRAREELHRELAEVRSRYVHTAGLGFRISKLVDRMYAFLYRRYCLLRFCHRYSSKKVRWSRGVFKPYAHFASARPLSVSWTRVLLTLIPLVGRRFADNLVKTDVSLIHREVVAP